MVILVSVLWFLLFITWAYCVLSQKNTAFRGNDKNEIKKANWSRALGGFVKYFTKPLRGTSSYAHWRTKSLIILNPYYYIATGIVCTAALVTIQVTQKK